MNLQSAISREMYTAKSMQPCLKKSEHRPMFPSLSLLMATLQAPHKC